MGCRVGGDGIGLDSAAAVDSGSECGGGSLLSAGGKTSL